MPKYEVAHIREQGQDMIIFPLEARYGHLSQADQERELDVLLAVDGWLPAGRTSGKPFFRA